MDKDIGQLSAVNIWPLRRFSLLKSGFKAEKDYASESAAELSLIYKPASNKFQVERLSRRLAEFCLLGVTHPPVISLGPCAAKIGSDGSVLSEFRVYFVTDGDFRSFVDFVKHQAPRSEKPSSASEGRVKFADLSNVPRVSQARGSNSMSSITMHTALASAGSCSNAESRSTGASPAGSSTNHPSSEFPMTDWLSAFRVVNDLPAISSTSVDNVVAHFPGTSSFGVHTSVPSNPSRSSQGTFVSYTRISSNAPTRTDHNASSIVPQTISGLYSQTPSSQHVRNAVSRSQDLFCVQESGASSQANNVEAYPLNFITPEPSQQSTAEVRKGSDSEDACILYSDASTQTTPADLMESLLNSPTRLKKVVQQAVRSGGMNRLVDCVAEVAPSLAPKPKKAKRQGGSATRHPLRTINDGQTTN